MYSIALSTLLTPCSDGEGFLIVYSITSRATFERVERIVERVLRVKDETSLPSSPVDSYGRPYPPAHPYGYGAASGSRKRIPIVIVGNKKDYYQGREVSTEEGKMLATSMGCDFYETSAKTNSNVEACFKSVVRQIKVDKRGYATNGNAAMYPGPRRKKKCVIL